MPSLVIVVYFVFLVSQVSFTFVFIQFSVIKLVLAYLFSPSLPFPCFHVVLFTYFMSLMKLAHYFLNIDPLALKYIYST